MTTLLILSSGFKKSKLLTIIFFIFYEPVLTVKYDSYKRNDVFLE